MNDTTYKQSKGAEMYNASKEFYEIFNDDEFNKFIDKTYLKLEDVRGERDYKSIEGYVDEIVKKYSRKCESSIGIFGMPASGKTTLSSMINKEILSTDKFLAEIRKVNQNFPVPEGKSDVFRKHEYKVISCLILSGLANNKILDFGGAALLQPGLALISRKVLGNELLNLSIDDDIRIYNLTQDALILGDELHRDIIIKEIWADKTITRAERDELKNNCIQLKDKYGSLYNAGAKIGELTNNDAFAKIFNICEKFDISNRWRKKIFDGVSKPLSFEEAEKKLSIKKGERQCQM